MTMRDWALNDQMRQAQQGLYQQPRVERDPTVRDAADALSALQKRANELRQNLAKVDGWKAELEKVERMLAAAEAP